MPRLNKLLPVLLLATCAAKKPKGPPPPPPVGWHQAAGWSAACYNPPAFGELGLVDRRSARDEALRALMDQWHGQRNDGVQFDDKVIETVETVMLGTPEKIEVVATENYQECAKAMSGGGIEGWKAWLSSVPTRMLQGVCRRPLDDQMFWYLELGASWQFAVSICEDDVVEITATEADKYRVDDGTDWINADGDRSKPASGAEYPCNTEGCFVGQLVMRFRGQSGAVIIKPVGTRLVFDPPEHGTIDVTVNDVSYFNNVFRIERGLQDRTGITYTPLD